MAATIALPDDPVAMLLILRKWFQSRELRAPCGLVFETRLQLDEFWDRIRHSPTMASAGIVPAYPPLDNLQIVGFKLTSLEDKP